MQQKETKTLLKSDKSKTRLDNLSKALRANLLRRKKVNKGEIKKDSDSTEA